MHHFLWFHIRSFYSERVKERYVENFILFKRIFQSKDEVHNLLEASVIRKQYLTVLLCQDEATTVRTFQHYKDSRLNSRAVFFAVIIHS